MQLNPFARRALRLPPVEFAAESDRTAPLPRVLWIELTSRCPFDCVFCSRKLLRGTGTHMDFGMYERLIAELGEAQTIRLNYSGESAHYPKIVEACTLATATGAQVELVSALAALPEHRLDALALSGLSQLTISLHTLDPRQFQQIYGFSSIGAMRQRIERVVELAASATRPLQVDFAFVAMRRNLDQLDAVAAYAQTLGLRRLAVHPVIRRDPIAETFAEELDGDRLRPEFAAELRTAVEKLRRDFPHLAIESSTPELADCSALDHVPRYVPGPLPEGARIDSCDQDPWETVHILADGRVVSCEERDRIELGNLHDASLAQIWHGAAYTRFRADYRNASDAHCQRCPYKRAHFPLAVPSRFTAAGGGHGALLDGWHAGDHDGAVRWSRQRASMRLRARDSGWLHVRGLLPSAQSDKNGLRILGNGVELASLRHSGAEMRPFELRRRIISSGDVRLEFHVEQMYCPRERGDGDDTRRLGVGLIEASWQPG